MTFERCNINTFDSIFEIMDSSFPDSEMRVYDEQKELFNNKFYKMYICKENDNILGFIAIWDFDEFIFVEHIAITEKARGKGIGSRVIEYIKETYKNKQIVLEVEPPENEIATRRIGFYKRLGFIFNEYYYEQMPLRRGNVPIQLYIMTFPNSISETEFEGIKNTLYKYVYECL